MKPNKVACSIAYSDSGSGTYLSTTLFPKLGVQPITFFAGALTTSVRWPDAARALIRFLASPEAARSSPRLG